MSIADVPVEATHPSTRRSPGRTPEAVTALAGRIRALQRSEPRVIGDERTAALAELALLELQVERLSLRACDVDTDPNQLLTSTFSVAEHVDRIARLWPSDAAPNLPKAAAHRAHRYRSRPKAA